MRLLLLFLALGALAPAAAAQTPTGWDGERALELIRRAQERRALSVTDTAMLNYRAEARAYVYFYLDREDTGERNLVKTDQLALEVMWQAPNQTKQRIIGWRDEKSLPTNIHYHLDHLTVVQENFGDEIRLGDGDEVRGVPHPAAWDAERFYHYRLTDSLTLRLPGAAEPVQVYEVQVRPRDAGQPAFVGSVFIDRRSGDLVRMDFTFTAAAYVDPYLDYINISLDNGLWRGRFWLPNEQRVEIRRRIPRLEIPAGSVIRANMRVRAYEFNLPFPPQTFLGPAVVALPRREREAFAFEEELHAELREEGLGPQMELGEIRKRAAQLAREQALHRFAGVRWRAGRASDVLRYNRAEGLALGVGLGLAPTPGLRLGVDGGYAFGAGHPFGGLTLEGRAAAARLRVALYQNRPRDVGVGPAASGLANTLAAVVAAEDYTDLYFARGAAASLRRGLRPGWALEAGARAELHRSATLASDFSLLGDGFREVRPIDEGTLLAADLRLSRRPPAGAARGWSLELAAEAGQLTDRGIAPGAMPAPPSRGRRSYLRPSVQLGWERRWDAADTRLQLQGDAGFALGELPRQGLFLLGGRGTLPGYTFRAFGGDRFAIGRGTVSAQLWQPWLRARAFGAVGWAGVGEAGAGALEAWGAAGTGGVRGSVGAGVGVVHDILRIDVARGLGPGGRWELVVESAPGFWDFL